MTRRLSFFAIALCLFVFLPMSVFAQESISFPMGVGVIDVTDAPYNARGDGKTDDTDAIQKALDEHPNGNRIIYLPKGTYLISRQLNWPAGQDTSDDYRRTILQGEHSAKVTIKLKNNSPAYGNAGIPRPILYTGLGYGRWRNSIRDITINTGKGNPGAIGIRFNSNRQGVLRNVIIRSGDGSGVYGIDMGFSPGIGPLLVQNVKIYGFETGIFTRFPTNGMTMEQIRLYGQSKYGIDNQGQNLSIRKLFYEGKATAIRNLGPTSVMTLLDARITGKGKKNTSEAAIINHNELYFRNVMVEGYKKSVHHPSAPEKDPKQFALIEWSSGAPKQLCASPDQTMSLPVAATPLVPWGAVGTWINIANDYGGTAGDGTDDTPAIQEAIDDGAETLVFSPHGRYTLVKDLIIRKNVRRIIGAEARLDGPGKIIIEKGLPPTVIIERFGALAGGIKHVSGRTLILQDVIMSDYESNEIGAGNLFLEDVAAESFVFNLQNVWARQLNFLGDKATKIENKGGILWILGLTSYGGGTLVHNTNRAETEILGASIISSGAAKRSPLFINEDASLSIAGLAEQSPDGNQYRVLVRETRAGATKELLKSDLPQGPSGSMIHVYSGYSPATGRNEAPEVQAMDDEIVILPNRLKVSAAIRDDGRADGHCQVPGEWRKVKGPGKVTFSNTNDPVTEAEFSYSGEYHLAYIANDGRKSAADTVVVIVFDRALTTGDHMGNGIPSGKGADAWVSSRASRRNYGKQKELYVSMNTDTRKTYLRYDLSQIPGKITDAALALSIKPEDKQPLRTMNVFGLVDQKTYGTGKLDEMWQEHKLNWDNAPGNITAPGGKFDKAANRGGGADAEYTDFLGTVVDTGSVMKNGLLRSSALRQFLLNDSSKAVTFILTAESDWTEAAMIAAKEHQKVRAPTLLVSYIDPNKTITGEYLPGGFQVSDVSVDPFTLACSFELQISFQQKVSVAVHKENGERIMLVSHDQMGSGKKHDITFDGSNLRSGKYILRIQGEGFKTEKPFTILN